MSKSTKKMILKLKSGEVTIDLSPHLAPNHVERVMMLADEGFYNNCPFHRVIDQFMAQTGDGSNHNGTGGSSYPDLKQEFSDEPHVRGTVSMARAQNVDSANSQFFICYDKTPHLDRQYTVIGKVTSGMDYIDAVKKGTDHSGVVQDPDYIEEAWTITEDA
tara:strand:+ start:2738 stop:3220 length:483 start_codon:yes stop_codon:yes gene_type:complete